jgi:DnaA family protein
MLFSPQIPLKLEPARENRFEDFVVGPNGPAVHSLQSLPDEQDKLIYISGPAGSGKSHLLNASCIAARERGLTAFYAGLRSMPKGSEQMLEGLENVDLVCVDDLQKVAGNKAWEESLFHCLNRIRASEGRIVLASDQNLSSLDLQLPDLVSRLQAGLRIKMLPLDDADKVRVLASHAASLGVEIPEEVSKYLIRHSSRNLSKLILHVDRLKQAAFAAKRRITVPLAREILGPGNSD